MINRQTRAHCLPHHSASFIAVRLWHALPFCHGSVVAPRPLHPHRWKCTQTVPVTLITIGDHIKCHRLAMHIFQTELTEHLGVDRATIQNWERNVYSPADEVIPKIVAWLGYDPRR
jgi:DNA-binding XRE family transcriptional regulator